MEQKIINIECTGAETRKLKELVIFQGNLKDLSKENFEKLKKEIIEDGFSEPISIWQDKDIWYILNGTQRLRVLQTMEKEGYVIPPLPVSIIQAKDEKQAARKCLALTSQFGQITMDGLVEFSEKYELKLEDIAVNFHFPEVNLEKFIIEQPNEKDDEVPEPPKEAKSKLGDLIELGRHRLLCGDATDSSAVERLMNGQKADMAFYSPPYNCNNELGTDKERKYITSNDNIDNYVGLIKDSTSLAIEYSKEVFVNIQLLANNKKDVLIWLSELSDFFKDIFFWKKKNCAPAIAKNVANSQTEVFVLFGKNNNRVFGNKRFHGTFYNFIETNSVSGENKNSKIHSAVMPLALPEHFIVNCYEENSLVLDMFGGTGTTLIACQKNNRICNIIELEPIYCDVIIQRYCDYVDNNKIKINGIEVEWQKS